MNNRNNDGLDSAALRLAEKQLARIVPGDGPVAILDAIAPCLRVEAGLIATVKPGPTMSLTHQVLRMPQTLFENWMDTQPEHLEQSFRPVVRSSPGDFWSATDGLPERLRKEMEVLQVLDQFGLGEGAGLKLLRQSVPGGEEHVMMALLTGRGERFPRQTAAMCRALARPLQDAVLRLGLPFTRGRSMHAQILENDNVGLVCLGTGGSIIALNQRAYDLAARYREIARVGPGRMFIGAFVKRALEETASSPAWQLVHPSRATMLQVRVHVMPADMFSLSSALPILKLEEWTLPSMPAPEVFPMPQVLQPLTPRERQVAMLLATTGLSACEIAAELKMGTRTVTTHTRNLYKTLGVRSRWELIALVRDSMN